MSHDYATASLRDKLDFAESKSTSLDTSNSVAGAPVPGTIGVGVPVQQPESAKLQSSPVRFDHVLAVLEFHPVSLADGTLSSLVLSSPVTLLRKRATSAAAPLKVVFHSDCEHFFVVSSAFYQLSVVTSSSSAQSGAIGDDAGAGSGQDVDMQFAAASSATITASGDHIDSDDDFDEKHFPWQRKVVTEQQSSDVGQAMAGADEDDVDMALLEEAKLRLAKYTQEEDAPPRQPLVNMGAGELDAGNVEFSPFQLTNEHMICQMTCRRMTAMLTLMCYSTIFEAPCYLVRTSRVERLCAPLTMIAPLS